MALTQPKKTKNPQGDKNFYRDFLKQDPRMAEKVSYRLRDAMFQLKGFFLCENADYVKYIQNLRSLYRARKWSEWGKSDDGKVRANDPDTMNTVERAVSGFLSYHYSPREEFMELQKGVGSSPGISADEVKALGARTKAIHQLFQTAENLACEGSVINDKVVFGLGGKLLTFVDGKFVQLHYAPEDLALGSSDGLQFNIFGKKEQLNIFRIYSRYKDMYRVIRPEGRLPQLGIDEHENFYTLQMPTKVWESHLQNYLTENQGVTDRDWMKIWARLNPGTDWVEVTWADRTVVDVKGLNNRSMIISFAFPAADRMAWTDGMGDRAKGISYILTQTFRLNVTAYERTMAPPWAVPEESANYGLNITKDGIIFTGANNNVAQPLSLKADINAMIAYDQYLRNKLDRSFYIDVFELLPKVNMPTTEVNIRDDNNLRKLGLYTIQDEKDNLVPTARFINGVLDDINPEEGAKISEMLATARFISPLTAAHRNSYFDKVNKVMLGITNVGKARQNNELLDNLLDYRTLITKLVERENLEEALLDGEKIDARIEIQGARESIKNDAERAKAARAVLENAQLRRDLSAQPEPGAAQEEAQPPDTGLGFFGGGPTAF